MGVNTERPWALLVLATVIAAVLGTFAAVVGFDFVVFDDDINIVLNPHLGELNAEAWRWLWTDTSYMRRYLPLGWIAFFALFQMGGLDPFYYHAANLLVHTVNAVLVFLACVQLLEWRARKMGDTTRPGTRYAVAGLAVLLWACHPMRAESVAWASGLLYLLSVSAALVAWILFVYAETHEVPWGWRWASVAAFAMSALVYPVALGLPCLVFAWRWGQRAAGGQPLKMGVVVPYVAISAMTLAAALFARWSGSEPGAASEVAVSTLARLGRAAYMWIYYLWRPFWPVELSPVYDTFLDAARFGWLLGVPALLLVGVTGVAIAQRKTWPWLLPLWCGYLACLLPHSGLLEGAFFPADRYGYFIGAWQVTVLAVICQGLRGGWRFGAMAVAAAACCVLAFRAREQSWIWRDSDALFARIDQTLSLPWARASYRMRYAVVLAAQGRADEARRVEDEVARLAPGIPASKNRELARGFVQLGETMRLPPFAVQHHAVALMHLRQKNFRGATAHLSRALLLAPDYTTARYNLALALAENAKPREALGHFFRIEGSALSAQPRDGFWRTLAESFRARGEERLAAAAEKRMTTGRS